MSNQTKHTAGGWRTLYDAPARVDGANNIFVYAESPKRCVAKLGCFAMSSDEVEANARLIAAAPELLSALKMMRDIRQKQWQECAEVAFVKGQTLLPWDEIKQADAAIAKAEGRRCDDV